MWIIQYESNPTVSRYAGTLPVLLTNPDGAPASAKPPGVTEREGSTQGAPARDKPRRHFYQTDHHRSRSIASRDLWRGALRGDRRISSEVH